MTVIWEAAAPQRQGSRHQLRRWLNNAGAAAINITLNRLFVPAITIGAAFGAEKLGLGLFNNLGLGFWPALAGSLLLLDLSAWFFHWLSHKVHLVWRIHALHHTDTELDFSTAYRHHPLDALYSAGQAIITTAVVGPPAVAAALYSLFVAGWTIIRHGNVRLPEPVERLLRLVVVTPAMHSVHHSPHQRETDSNYGIVFPWWDRLFGTYIQKTPAEREAQPMGLETFREPHELYLHRMLMVPFAIKRPGRTRLETSAAKKRPA